jgi:hypothetical protein
MEPERGYQWAMYEEFLTNPPNKKPSVQNKKRKLEKLQRNKVWLRFDLENIYAIDKLKSS